jgi:hypothetical protein
MDFWQTLALLGRHWLFFGVALVLAVVVTAGTFEAVKPQYEATTNLLLVPPSESISSTSVKVSPYDAYGNLNTVASIVSDAESSQGSADRLEREGVNSSYTVGTDPTGAVPELILSVTASSSQDALAQDATLTRDAITSLREAQLLSGANPRTFVTASYLARPVSAPADDKSRLRVGVAAGVVLVFLAVALTFMYDSVTRRRASPKGPGAYERDVSSLRGADGSAAGQEAQLAANTSAFRKAPKHYPFTTRARGSTQPGSTSIHQAQDR